MEKRHKINLGEVDIIGTDQQLTLSEIQVKRKYCVDVAIYQKQQFIGDLVPIPLVLIDYLSASEIRVFARILSQLKNHSTCQIRRKTLAKELGVSETTITTVLNSLESIGIITQDHEGRRKLKKINFNTIQKLNDILKDRLPGAARAFRNEMGDQNINNPKEIALELLDIKYTEKTGVEAEEYV